MIIFLRNIIVGCGVLLACVPSILAETPLRIVGSSTIFPWAALVAEHTLTEENVKSPVIERTGTGGGIKLFCGGVGDHYPEIVMASRPFKISEYKECAQHGVEFSEILIGYDGIVIAYGFKEGEKTWALSRHHLFNALSRYVIIDGQKVNNPYKTWQEIDPDLPPYKIEILGPSVTSGTRETVVELVLQHEALNLYGKGCNKEEWCEIRQDGAYIEVGDNQNLIIQKLGVNPFAVGIIGFGYFASNQDKISAVTIDGQRPNVHSIRSQEYPLARPLYLYIKNNSLHAEEVRKYTKAFLQAASPRGYLEEYGLVAR